MLKYGFKFRQTMTYNTNGTLRMHVILLFFFLYIFHKIKKIMKSCHLQFSEASLIFKACSSLPRNLIVWLDELAVPP